MVRPGLAHVVSAVLLCAVARPAVALAADSEGVDAWLGAVEAADRPQAVEDHVDVDEITAGWATEAELLGLSVPRAFYEDPATALKVDPLYLDIVDPSEFDLPVVVNDEVAKWVRYFTGPGRKYYARWLSRSTAVRPMMYRELAARGLPLDLVYLSMIESGYSAKALSHAGASGMWQFMPATGRSYDLRVDAAVDDRRDPELATIAAAEHLRDLYEALDDWYLAFAAYNAGQGRVSKAIRRSGSRDFWVHARGPYLHSETDNYVPKILAAAIIGKHPERYGFVDIAYQPELSYDSVMVDTATDLAVLAECAGVSRDALAALNPALRGNGVPVGGHVVRLPAGTSASFSTALAAIPTSERVRSVVHVVRRGETLSLIASRYGVGLSQLSAANGIRNANQITVGTRLQVPAGGSPVAVASASGAAATSRTAAPAVTAPSSHTVSRGDTLSGLASRYGLSVADLKALNGLRGDVITPGQKLSLRGGGAAKTSVATRTHKVRAGDTLSAIAAASGVSMANLQAWNGIRDPSSIRVGQVLSIHGGSASASWDTHTVSRGDTLSAIASRYGCSTQELCAWNELGNASVIHPGQRLKVKRG